MRDSRGGTEMADTASTLLSKRDLHFMLFEWLQVQELAERPRFQSHSLQTFEDFLEISESLAERQFASHNQKSDRHEPTFVDGTIRVISEVSEALTAFSRSGLLAAWADESLGGVQLPNTIQRACFAWFQAANISTAAYPMLTMANANLLMAHGSPTQVELYARPMLEGRFFGTMCLSEPHAGSSLSDVSTRATPAADGTYRLTGNKMWVSGGDHELSENIVHLVLARAQDGPLGVKGLSLFIVPKFLVNPDGSKGARNDVVAAGLNHKMGYRGTTNTLLNFGEGKFSPNGSSGAVGYLVGQENDGLKYMFHMMNEARIGVGAGGVALGYTGYLHALSYARNRPQGRLPGEKDPSSAQMPIVKHADVRRMLLASKSYVEGGMALVLYCSRLLDEQMTARTQRERDRAELLLDVLTPIVKSWPAQWCLDANDHAIQIHGGYGYTRDYPVEQFYRDNRLNAIHEGTTGIQALDLLGRKVVVNNGQSLEFLAEAMRETCTRAVGELEWYGNQLSDAVETLLITTQKLWAPGSEAIALANAAVYLEAAGHVVVAWMWLEQAIAVGSAIGTFYDGKRLAVRYFFTHELPRVSAQFALLQSVDTLMTDFDDACL